MNASDRGTAHRSRPHPKVVALIGSPRLDGNTHTMAKEVLKGAEAEGAKTEEIFLDRYWIRPASEVGDEWEHRVDDRRADDFPILLDKFIESDVVVWSSPVYWHSMTAQLKLFCDRLGAYCYRPENKERMRMQIHVAVSASDRKDNPKYVIDAIRYLWEYILDNDRSDADFMSVSADEVYEKGTIHGRRELEECRMVGAGSIRRLRKKRAGEA